MGQRGLLAYLQEAGTPRPRRKEETHPGRISIMWNLATPMRSQGNLSKLTAREAERLSGRRRDQEAKAANRKGTGRHNWADRAIPTLKSG